ncbi:NUDIX hydrolase [Magnetospirillum aberrantis]|uniref:NUDIX hydrolase n=1 Tax=Magnetospirillum aberrantis SpK TaxID=908842 RepID=A0A7C9UX29_9PROT|nr:NUDIX hydrolase [Magnetospirillum aberrantis]NFV80572.1 NUDIX hydrolase [Magnetospirillum aberrantis SpK]
MNRDYPPHPIPAALAMVVRDGRVLLARRGKGNTPDPWGFPGGAVEVGETVLAAAQRELAEETGIRARPERVVEVFDIIVHDASGRVRTHFVVNAVRMTTPEGEAHPASDVIETGWFTLDQISTLPRHPNLDRLAAAMLDASPA